MAAGAAGSALLRVVEALVPHVCGVAVTGALYRGFLGTNPQSPGPDTDLGDFAGAFHRTAYVLAALAIGAALLVFRLGRVPASTSAEDGEGAAGRPGADR